MAITKIKTVETFRADTETEAENFIMKLKENANDYDLRKYGITKKEKKAKGEIIDEGYEVTATKVYNDFWEC